jgi:pSer/pThr/pTyr-binding forkhead associated (FHA) protein
MTFPAEMRIGSLEILAGLAVFGAVVGRRRFAAAPSGPENMIVQLAVDGRAIELEISEGRAPRVIGRSSEGDVPLGDPETSRRHAALQAAGGALYITDLGSRNGTFLNGKRLANEGIELKVGDQVDVGNTRIEVLEIRALP